MMIFLSFNCTAHAQGKIQSGLWKMYQGNVLGNLANSKKAKLDGVAFQYYDNGNIQRESWYKDNQLQGETKFFSKDNQLTKIHSYDQGKLVEVTLK